MTMKILLIDIDSKIPNLALMKLSTYYKKCKYKISFNSHFGQYDKVYTSCIFTWNKNKVDILPFDNIEIGGSGYNLNKKLPHEIETLFPDYSLYPNFDYSLGFTTRGCLRKCSYCVVPQKEGKLKIVGDIYNFWNNQHKKIMLLDNNILGLPDHFKTICQQLIKEKLQVDFNQGLDIRLLTPEIAHFLSKLKYWKQLRFAFDNMSDESAVKKGIQILLKAGISKYKLSFYVLIGFNTILKEDLYRVNLLKSLKIDPFVMIYRNNHKQPTQLEKDFARWVNHKAIFKSIQFEDYKKYKPYNKQVMLF